MPKWWGSMIGEGWEGGREAVGLLGKGRKCHLPCLCLVCSHRLPEQSADIFFYRKYDTMTWDWQTGCLTWISDWKIQLESGEEQVKGITALNSMSSCPFFHDFFNTEAIDTTPNELMTFIYCVPFLLTNTWPLHFTNVYVYHRRLQSAYSLNQLSSPLCLQLTHAYREQKHSLCTAILNMLTWWL